MRVRITDNMTRNYCVHTDANGSGCSAPVVTSNDAGKIGEYQRTVDQTTPRYNAQRKAGSFIVNPFVSEHISRSNSIQGIHVKAVNPWPATSCYLEATRDGPQLTELLNGSGEGLAPKFVISSDQIVQRQALASTNCWADLAAGEAQLLVFLAELHKTIAMLRNPLGNFRKFLLRVRSDKNASRSAVKRLLTVGEYLRSEWLSYRYGVRPFVKDLKDITIAIRKDRSSKLRIARGKESLVATSSETKFRLHGDLRTDYIETSTDTVKVRCGLGWEANMSVADDLGFTPTAIPGLIWELLPYSFVVDWFVNLGSYVQTISPHPLVKQLGQWTVTERTVVTVRSVLGSSVVVNPSLTDMLRQASGAETVVYRLKQRVPAILPPQIRTKIDLSQFSASDLRIADAVALVTQILRSK